MKNQKNSKKILFAFILLVLLTIMAFYDRKTIRMQLNSEKDASNSPNTSDWTYNGIPICTAIDIQKSAQICSDGDGGAIIVWLDKRVGAFEYDIYAQRVNSTGDVNWTTNGIAVCTHLIIEDPIQICSDGAGGAIITFVHGLGDSRNVYAERVDDNGVVRWGSGSGIYICSVGGYEGNPQICSDGAGGAIITWYDSRGGDSIYAQKVDASGAILWTANGVPLSPTSNMELDPQICSDGAGGAIITWEDHRGTDGDVYAQRINSAGVLQWSAGGIPICTVTDVQTYLELGPQICSDGAGGAIITWEDHRVDDQSNVYAQKVNATGNIQWTLNGRSLTLGASTSHPQICSDGAGGAFVSFQFYFGYGLWQVYVERIDSNGLVQWGDDGKFISWIHYTKYPQICSDGAGGAIITWEKVDDIYAQHINSALTELWTIEGEPLCTASGNQNYPQLCSNGAGGAIITWEDQRTEYDIYAFLIQSALPTSNHPENVITAIGRSESIGWNLSDDIDGGQYRVILNNTNGSYYEWIGWTPWIIDTLLNVPINVSTIGVFNYTIEFYDSHNQTGSPDTVIVIIEENDAPTSNHPKDINTVEYRTETISWMLSDDYGGGQYQIVRNSMLWKDWTSWIINESFEIPIDTTIIGSYNYTILYHDDQNLFGTQDTVIVNIANDQNPTTDHPADIITVLGDNQYIRWTLNDDYGGGSYRIIANDSLGSFYVYRSWELWSIGQTVSISINRTKLGVFNYTIEYYDSLNQFGVPDTVLVTVNQNNPPTCNHPEDVTTTKEDTETIQWLLSDDYGGGTYRIVITTSAGVSSIWIDWTSWDVNVPINVPIDRTRTGVFNYTIEYRDMYSVYGMADTVKVTIPGAEESFPLPLLYAIIGSVGVAAVILSVFYLKKRKS